MRFSSPKQSPASAANGGAWLGESRARVYRARHGGDWLVLALFAVMPFATGISIWLQLGWQSATGRAAFWGLALVAVALAWAIYASRIAVRILVSHDGLAIRHGPRRWHLAWSEVNRLLERSQLLEDQRYRWVVAEAHDGRRLQVREDRVADYPRFRADVYAAYQEWREQSGSLGARWASRSSGLLIERELPGGSRWLGSFAVAALAVGVYLWTLIPAVRLVGAALLAGGALTAGARAGVWLRQQTVAVDGEGIEAHRRLRSRRLEWNVVSRVERRRHPLGPWVVALARAVRRAGELLGRPNPWTGGSPWAPRVPEELILRGTGRQLRIRLDRLEHPDDLVAQVDRYTRALRRRATAAMPPSAPGRPTKRLAPLPSRDTQQSTTEAGAPMAPRDDSFGGGASPTN